METINQGAIAAALSEGGAIAAALPQYESRAAQIALAQLITQAFNEDGIAAAEAGTGVGKSFAYLVPALAFAEKDSGRVVISTATITLQQQLYEKDIPLVSAALKSPVKTVLMKGRGNYLCRRRLDEALREGDLAGSAEAAGLEAVARWAETSSDGDRCGLSEAPADQIWARVCSDADLCMNKRCPYFDRCFVQALRAQAAAAQILVVNHHLLFADLAARRDGGGYESSLVLPPYQRVIIDEAHTIENAATSFFSTEFGRAALFQLLGRLYRKRRAAVSGLLPRFCALLPADGTGEDALDTLAAAAEKIRAAAESLDAPALELAGIDGTYRFSPMRDNSGSESALFPAMARLQKTITAFAAAAGRHIESISEEERQAGGSETAVWELQAVIRRLEAAADTCAAFRQYRLTANRACWIEKRGQGRVSPWAAFTCSPVDLSGELRASLFAPHKTVVCVSATLAVKGDFSYWLARTGAAGSADGGSGSRRCVTGCFPSPFPYDRNVFLGITTDGPPPDYDGYQDYINAAVERVVLAAGGSALVLFTSYQTLNATYAAAAPAFKAAGIRCYKQGDGDRSRLLQKFIEDESSVLFGTDSFWEGVDAPGDTLRLVVLTRLPFRAPSDPVFEARREAVEKAGGNAFMELSLPEGIMKFKQGFGRLIRRGSDRGVVAVLDSRIIFRRYGMDYIYSLPETRIHRASLPTIARKTTEFLAEKADELPVTSEK